MDDDPDNRELAHRIELLKKDFDVLKADISAKLDQMTAEAEKRDKDNQRWIVGIGIAQLVITIAVIAAGFAFFGILVGLPR
ncbi:MAG: hypothetical protein OXC68_08355 [Aestuariivita sp.]|nr:hypothetical protein [Aestuariivita sp.]